MNKYSFPDGLYRCRVSPLKLILDIKQSLLMQNVGRCQCIVSKRSCGSSPLKGPISVAPRTTVLKTVLENFDQLFYLCIFRFSILNTELSIKHVSKLPVPYSCNFLFIGV